MYVKLQKSDKNGSVLVFITSQGVGKDLACIRYSKKDMVVTFLYSSHSHTSSSFPCARIHTLSLSLLYR